MADVFVGLGANLGDPVENLRVAVRRLRETIAVDSVSSLYRSEPVGVVDQPSFVNAVLAGTTGLEPEDLLSRFLKIERDLGRVRAGRMGPRTLDLDLLLYGSRVARTPDLIVPHPRMGDRRFVLAPLAEIAPDARHPVSHRTAAEMLADLPVRPAVERLDISGWPPPEQP